MIEASLKVDRKAPEGITQNGEEPRVVGAEVVEDTAELYRKYRPTKFKDVLGQEEAVSTLVRLVKEKRVPHALLFTGPSGVGKTTLARIMAGKLGCHPKNDTFEINAAEARGIDTIRSIMDATRVRPLSGPARAWIIDEAAKVTDDGQGAMLKALEEAPSHAYFMLATTHPVKLRDAIRTRCTRIDLKSLNKDALRETVLRMVRLSGSIAPDDMLLNKLIEVSNGSARKIVVDWDRVRSLPTQEAQLKALEAGFGVERQAIELCRTMLQKEGRWSEAAEIISSLREKGEEEPESIRCMVLSYCTTILLKKDDKLAHFVLTCFEDRVPWSGVSGWASITRASYEVFQLRKR